MILQDNIGDWFKEKVVTAPDVIYNNI